jgi:hypothetical protein
VCAAASHFPTNLFCQAVESAAKRQKDGVGGRSDLPKVLAPMPDPADATDPTTICAQIDEAMRGLEWFRAASTAAVMGAVRMMASMTGRAVSSQRAEGRGMKWKRTESKICTEA